MLRISLTLSLMALALGAAATACGSDSSETGTPGDPCVGGVLVNEHCEAKCDPTKCLQQAATDTDPGFRNTCVGNVCQLVCSSVKDCYDTQDCAPAVEDGTNVPINVCKSSGKARGFGYGCPFGNECDPTGPSGPLKACPNGAPCPDACGTDPANKCVLDDGSCRGVKDCNLGRCQADGLPCRLTEECAAAECQELGCLTTGMADADAYCTRFDCAADTDCPGGYWCGVVRLPNQICGTTKGNNGFPCGTTKEDCIDLKNLPPGTSYFEGAACLERRVCMKRQQCAPCEADVDCTQVGSQKCGLTLKACGRLCDQETDCAADSYCDLAQPSVDPGIGLSKGLCVPKFNACKGTGQFCQPCRNDEDCLEGGATCYSASLSGEQACLKIPLDSCTTDSTCPKAPGGKFGECSGASGPGPAQQCFFPFNSTKGRFVCW